MGIFIIKINSRYISWFISVKENKWYNVYHEFESTESGAYVVSGDAYKYEFTDKWIYILGVPVWRLYYNSKNIGLWI